MSGNWRNRPNWTLSMTVVVLAALAAAFVGSVTTEEPAAAERFYLRNSAGSVLFDHDKHQETVDSCAACHHDLLGSGAGISCAECHGDDVDPADFEHAELKEYHEANCLNCHEQEKEDTEALSCRSCHPAVQENEPGFNGCSDCHDDGYEPDMLEHQEYLEIEDHSCLGCHTPESTSEAYHAGCFSCHIEESPERFLNQDSTVNCGGCHLR